MLTHRAAIPLWLLRVLIGVEIGDSARPWTHLLSDAGHGKALSFLRKELDGVELYDCACKNCVNAYAFTKAKDSRSCFAFCDADPKCVMALYQIPSGQRRDSFCLQRRERHPLLRGSVSLVYSEGATSVSL